MKNRVNILGEVIKIKPNMLVTTKKVFNQINQFIKS